ncbi:MAG: hypothetical protein MK052_08945 [Alphaproteobacteria bacterium]|nr:hypothetical protein [Alphaproteobacteria bacterium]
MSTMTAHTDLPREITDAAAVARTTNPVLDHREHFAKEYAIMKAHIKNVGFEHFANEQMQMDKIFKALAIAGYESSELASHLDAIGLYFDYYSPRSAQYMLDFITEYVHSAAQGKPIQTTPLHKMLDRIHQLLTLPDTMLDTLGRRGGAMEP